MKKENIINEFLQVIGYNLFAMERKSLKIENKEEIITLPIPINFTPKYTRNTFRYSQSKDGYRVCVNGKKKDSKNNIKFFNLSLSKSKANTLFRSDISHNGTKYVTTIKKNTESYYKYRKENKKEQIIIMFSTFQDEKKLELTSSQTEVVRKIEIKKKFLSSNPKGTLRVLENGQVVFKQELASDVIDDYLEALAYRLKSIVEESNNGIKILNEDIFEMIFTYNNIALDFLNLVRNGMKSNIVIDNLLTKYFKNIYLNDIEARTAMSQNEEMSAKEYKEVQDDTPNQKRKELEGYKTYLKSSTSDKGEIALQRKMAQKKE